MRASRGMSVGTNQIDASTQQNEASPAWKGLYPFKERTAQIAAGSAIPLFTGDEYIMVASGWSEYSQVAIETSQPLPANVTAVIIWYTEADTSG